MTAWSLGASRCGACVQNRKRWPFRVDPSLQVHSLVSTLTYGAKKHVLVSPGNATSSDVCGFMSSAGLDFTRVLLLARVPPAQPQGAALLGNRLWSLWVSPYIWALH